MPELARQRDLGGVVHRERDQAVDVARREARVGQRGQGRLAGQLQLGAARLLGELRRADAGDGRLAAEEVAHGATTTLASTWCIPLVGPSVTTSPTTARVSTPSASSVIVAVNRTVS